MSRNQYLQLYLETNNQIYRAKEKNQQCGLSNPQSHMDKTKIDRDVCMPAQHTGRRYLYECGGLHGQTSASNCSVQNLGVTWGPLQLSQPFIPQPQGWCNSMQLLHPRLFCYSVWLYFWAFQCRNSGVQFRTTFCTLLKWVCRYCWLCLAKVCSWFCTLKTKTSKSWTGLCSISYWKCQLKQLQFSLLQL